MANREHLEILKQGVEVWNKWRDENKNIIPQLSNASFGEVDFSKVVLNDADLTEVNLRSSNLSGANIRGAILTNAILSGADLTKVNLSGARLRGANLSGANLTDVDLENANLTSANLSGANLSGVSLERAICRSTVFGYVDLSVVKGLETVRHHGPSTLGIDTLYKSQDKIPEVFLRGCGVPDTMITFTKSLVRSAIDYYSCFISYSTANEDFAKLLYDTLQGAGIRCWFAPEQILPGERIDEAIDYGIKYWDKVLFCASKSSLTEKWWVDFEVDKAFKKARDLQRERGVPIGVIIPLNLDGYLFTPEYDMHPKRSIFEMMLAADFVGWKTDLDKFNREVQKVIKALRTDGGKEPLPKPKL